MELRQEMQMVRESTQKRALTIQDIGREFVGRSVSWMFEHPWWFPLEPDVPGRPAIYYRSTVEAWLRKSEDERKALYAKHRSRRSHAK